MVEEVIGLQNVNMVRREGYPTKGESIYQIFKNILSRNGGEIYLKHSKMQIASLQIATP